MQEIALKEKINKLQMLQFGAKTEGERISAIKAKVRLIKKMETNNIINKETEYKFSLKHSTNVNIFIDILNNYEYGSYRKHKQIETIIIAKVPGFVVDNIIWPEYLATPNRI